MKILPLQRVKVASKAFVETVISDEDNLKVGHLTCVKVQILSIN